MKYCPMLGRKVMMLLSFCLMFNIVILILLYKWSNMVVLTPISTDDVSIFLLFPFVSLPCPLR